MQRLETYRLSGKFSPLFVPVLVAIAVVGAVVAVPYQWLLLNIPFILINILLVLVLGFLMYGLMKKGIAIGRCRNRIVAAVAGVGVGLATIGATHFASYWMALREMGVTSDELPLSHFLDLVIESGWYIGDSESFAFTGLFVIGVWGVEAIIVAGLAGYAGLQAAAHPYCEDCDEWTDEGEAVLVVASPTTDLSDRMRRAEGFDELLQFEGAGEGAFGRDLVYKAYCCPECVETTFLTVLLRIYGVDKDGNETIKDDALQKNLAITPEQFRRVVEAEVKPPVGEDDDAQGAQEFEIDVEEYGGVQ